MLKHMFKDFEHVFKVCLVAEGTRQSVKILKDINSAEPSLTNILLIGPWWATWSVHYYKSRKWRHSHISLLSVESAQLLLEGLWAKSDW